MLQILASSLFFVSPSPRLFNFSFSSFHTHSLSLTLVCVYLFQSPFVSFGGVPFPLSLFVLCVSLSFFFSWRLSFVRFPLLFCCVSFFTLDTVLMFLTLSVHVHIVCIFAALKWYAEALVLRSLLCCSFCLCFSFCCTYTSVVPWLTLDFFYISGYFFSSC